MKLSEDDYKAMSIVMALSQRMGSSSGIFSKKNKEGSDEPIIKTKKKEDGTFEVTYFLCKDGHELTPEELADANKIAQKDVLKYVDMPLV